MRILLPLLLISVAACTQTPRQLEAQAAAEAGDRAAIDRELAGFTPGPPQSCVQQTQLREMSSHGDTLIYRSTSGVRYVNHTSGGCSPDRDDAFLVTRTPSTSLCRGDIAQAINRTSRFPVGSCSYGDFVPYRRAK